MTDEKERAIDKAQKLIAKAESTEFEAERDALLAKAHQIMHQHAIEMIEIRLRGEARDVKEEIIEKRVPLFTASVAYLDSALLRLATAVAQHCRVQTLVWDWDFRARVGCKISAFGLESDVEYFETLLTSLRLHILEEIDPKYDPEKTFEENVYMMKSAGLPWKTIGMRCDPETYPTESSWNPRDGRWIRVYKAHCASLGETPHGSSPKNYQFNFVNSYAVSIDRRLREMRKDESGNSQDNLPALVDHGKQVREFIASKHKTKSLDLRRNTKHDHAAAARGHDAAQRADLHNTRIGGAGARTPAELS